MAVNGAMMETQLMPKQASMLTLITRKTLGVICLAASLGLLSWWTLFCVMFCTTA